jgi:alkylation response protein AidB-like acyl-CoA dehydrogenase
MYNNPYTEEHELLRQSLRKYIDREIIPHVDEWEKTKACPRHIFEQMGEQGFIGVTFPESVGGSGMDFWAAMVVSQEFARANIGGLAMSLYAHTYLPLPLINTFGTEEQKEKYLRPALAGKKVAALGITEPGAGSDVGGIQTTVTDAGDHYVLNGSKMYITNGSMADFIVLVVRMGEGYNMGLLIFETDTQGFSANRMDYKLGMHSSDTGHLFFDGCKVPKENLLGMPGMGFYYIMNNLQEERLLGAATAVYAAEYALDRAMQYARERHVFGRPVGKFQVNRHRFARMATQVQAGKSLVYDAVREFLEKGSEAVKIISMAKAFACEMANEVADNALQVYGGAGYMEEYGIARTWRDLRLLTIGAGTTEVMYEIISKLVYDDVKHEKQFINARKGETQEVQAV